MRLIHTEDGLLAQLSPRERQVAALVASGLTNKAIAHKLGISPHTVKGHLSAVASKLALLNRVQLAVWVHSRPKCTAGLAVRVALQSPPELLAAALESTPS